MSDNINLLKEAIRWCKEQPVWPKDQSPWEPGYSMVLDAETENILVIGPVLSFAITLKAVQEKLHEAEFEPVMKRLIEVHEAIPEFQALKRYVVGHRKEVSNV